MRSAGSPSCWRRAGRVEMVQAAPNGSSRFTTTARGRTSGLLRGDGHCQYLCEPKRATEMDDPRSWQRRTPPSPGANVPRHTRWSTGGSRGPTSSSLMTRSHPPDAQGLAAASLGADGSRVCSATQVSSGGYARRMKVTSLTRGGSGSRATPHPVPASPPTGCKECFTREAFFSPPRVYSASDLITRR
jgi:hypothetical protein